MFAFTQTVEDNYMSLTKAEIIEQIEQLEGGWWKGVGSGGLKKGLFPGSFHSISSL
jgi:drebrin-like protein